MNNKHKSNGESMSDMSGADALAASLISEGVEIVFGIPGVQIMAAVDAIHRSGTIRWISTRHEQTAAYMAYGYARTTGKTGVAMVLPGPGALNTTAAIGTAYSASTPVLLISGQIESYYLGLNKGVLHQLDEQVDIFQRITKWSGRASKVTEIPIVLQQAFHQLKAGRPRPVEIEVPFDLWLEKAPMSIDTARPTPPESPSTDEIAKAVRLITGAKRPVILAGGGAAKSGICEDVTKLAEHLKAPVVMTTKGQGSIHCSHPMCCGNFILWTNPALAKADVVIAIGTRMRASGSTKLELRNDQKLIQIDIDPSELGRNHRIDIGISADAHEVLTALLRELPKTTTSLWNKQEIANIRAGIESRLEKAAPLQIAIIRSINEVLKENDIVVSDITNIGYWSDIAYRVNEPHTYLDSSYFATLGFAFPTALGAKVGNPGKNVVALCGDGGFPYAATELATAVQEGINVVTIIFSDGAYGTVTGIQKREFGGRYVGNRLHNPDYVKFAESFGASGIRCRNHHELGEKLSKALESDRPVIIEVPVPLLDTPWDTLITNG
jgi:acetolactate synthase-1/2/3 large subunit